MYVDGSSEKWKNAISRFPCLSEYSEPVKKMTRALLGRDAQIHALLATFERSELCNALLLASPGSGKALDDATPIPVDDVRGYVRMGELDVGDVTFDEMGRPCRVTGVYPQGMCDGIEMTFAYGERIVCNTEHIWQARHWEHNGWGSWQSVTCGEMMAMGITDPVSGAPMWQVPTCVGLKRTVVSRVSDVVRLCVRSGVVFLPVSDSVLRASLPDRIDAVSALTAATVESLVAGEGGIVCSTVDVAASVAALATSCGMRSRIVTTRGNRYVVRVARATRVGDEDAAESVVSAVLTGDRRTMTCITVDSPNSLFVCGSCHVVTHNTALVQGTMVRDDARVYLEVNLSRMIAGLGNVDELGDLLKRLFAEASDFSAHSNKDLVLFIDEFHQIVQLSPAAVEALKPLLADSGTRGIRVIAATTNREFSEFVEANQPLVERFSQIRLHEPDKDTVVAILKSMAERYGVANRIVGNSLYELIYDVTNRHMVSEAQPRKSIMMLDSMVGWHRYSHAKMDKHLLAKVMYEQRNVNIQFSVDAASIRQELDAHVFAQEYATRAVEQRLQLSVAGLNDPTKPQGSFLLCGSTGTGKLVADWETVPALARDGSGVMVRIPHGELVPGDWVFDRLGRPTRVMATFRHEDVEIFRVTFADGRTLDVGDEHLWAVYDRGGAEWRILSTRYVYEAGLVTSDVYGSGYRWSIPMGGPVDATPVVLPCDPYVAGCYMFRGVSYMGVVGLVTDDPDVVAEVRHLLGDVVPLHAENMGGIWRFSLAKAVGTTIEEVMHGVVDDMMSGPGIPWWHMGGSVAQRMAFVQGAFDIAGEPGADGAMRLSHTDGRLVWDLSMMLFSLGIGNMVSEFQGRTTVTLRCSLVESMQVLRVGRVRRTVEDTSWGRSRRSGNMGRTSSDRVEIVDMQPIGRASAQCIYVDNDEHLYQAGPHVVTHNTELTKQLARILFPEGTDALIRLDMTEYANPDSLERFRLELTGAVSVQPYCIVLLDEVEKACAPVTRMLLSVLDDARLTDRHGRTVSFLNSYIVLTTNAGSEIYKTIAQYESSDNGSGEFVARYDKLIRRSLIKTTGSSKFPPELLGRIDTIVPFQPLSEATMERICRSKLQELSRRLLDNYGVRMVVDRRVIRYLIHDSLTTDSDAGGARAVVSKLESEVTTNVAAFVNRFPEIREISVSIQGELASENKTKVSSDAYVVVRGIQQD